jgi:hypothetical protein
MNAGAKVVLDRLTRLLQAWETIRPNETFAGLTLAQFREAVQPSLDARARVTELRSQLNQAVNDREASDETTYGLTLRAVSGVKALEGPNGSMYKDIGYKLARDRESGLTRKVKPPQPEAKAA